MQSLDYVVVDAACKPRRAALPRKSSGARRRFAAGSKVRGLPPLRPGRPRKRKPSGVTRGFPADFFGAIPVASALGAAAGATPPQRLQIIMAALLPPPKPELSTWQRIGTFYLALTVGTGRQ